MTEVKKMTKAKFLKHLKRNIGREMVIRFRDSLENLHCVILEILDDKDLSIEIKPRNLIVPISSVKFAKLVHRVKKWSAE